MKPRVLYFFSALLLFGQTESERKRLEGIKARHDRGETISAEDREFAQRIMAMGKNLDNAERNREYARTHPPRESTGLVPLTELGTGLYQGHEGGLYPGGKNEPPKQHLDAGLNIARSIAPIDGKIVFLTIGMSNTTQESQTFLKLAAEDKSINPSVALVDAAQGGQTAAVTARADANYWKVAEDRLKAASVTPRQVQVVWLKQANPGPSRPFPAEVKKLQSDLVATLHNLKDKYPNLKIAYLSSRIYAGYASTPLNPEPHAYEGGFAVKWLVASQVSGEELTYDPAKGPVRAPWLAWGPYLWGDGVKPRKDGLKWVMDDFAQDGTHPGIPGREKVARLLLEFLKSSPTSKPWFVR